MGPPTAISGKVHQRCAANLNAARMILAGYEHNIEEVNHLLSISAIIIFLYIYTHPIFIHSHIYIYLHHTNICICIPIYMNAFFKSSHSNEKLVKILSYLSGGAKLTQLP